MTEVGVIVIARNEGERLVCCLESLPRLDESVVVVDSGSTDGSVERARSMGVSVVELDMTRSFTAARARNEGFERLMVLRPNLKYVQFVDGDCVVQPAWIDEAVDYLERHPDYAVACGRRREQHPTASVYNQLTDYEWDYPVGDTTACGGDALIRSEVFRAVHGFNASLIAGEEPDLCLRIRQQGHLIRRLACEMTLHDAAIFEFSQWWKRTLRSGHAYAEVAMLHRAEPGRFWFKEVASIVLWGACVPLLILLSLVTSLCWSLVGLGLYCILGWKIYRYRVAYRGDKDAARLYALYCVLGKIAQAQGVVLLVWNRLIRGGESELIEYKGGS